MTSERTDLEDRLDVVGDELEAETKTIRVTIRKVLAAEDGEPIPDHPSSSEKTIVMEAADD